MKMKTVQIVIGLISFVFLISFVLAQGGADLIDLDSCIQQCEEEQKANCAAYPGSPLCPEDIPGSCEFKCEGTFGTTRLNYEFSLEIGDRYEGVGKKVVVEDYDNMEIALLSFSRTDKGQDIANLRVTKGDEIELVDVGAGESKIAFEVRIDFISAVKIGTQYFNEELGVWVGRPDQTADPVAGLFGVYEKGSFSFWDKVARWFRGLFG
jgi:hypothetical protein